MLTLSAYYSVDLGYKSYVTAASITGREDKSSTLPSNTNGISIPSFNLATVISDYARMPGPISFLKLKASYAESKNGGTVPLFNTNLANIPAAKVGNGITGLPRMMARTIRSSSRSIILHRPIALSPAPPIRQPPSALLSLRPPDKRRNLAGTFDSSTTGSVSM